MEQLTEKKKKSAKREEGGDWLGHEDDWRFKEARHLKARLSLSHLDVGQLHPAEYVGGARSDYGVRSDTMLESRRSAGVAATQPGRVYTRPVAHAINVQTASMVIPFPLFGQRQCSPAPAAISRNTGRSRPPCIMHKRHEDHLLGRTERCGRLAVIDLDYEITTTVLSTRRKSRNGGCILVLYFLSLHSMDSRRFWSLAKYYAQVTNVSKECFAPVSHFYNITQESI